MMRAGYDAAAKWAPFPAWRDAALRRDGWTARPVLGLHQTLASGDMAAVRAAVPLPLAEAGLWTVVSGPNILLRIARDRALLVSPEPIPLTPGWHAAGLAVSPASSAFAVCAIAGPAMPDVLGEAIAADLEGESPSAATLFAGLPCLLHRTAPDAARLHVEMGFLPYVWRWLEERRA